MAPAKKEVTFRIDSIKSMQFCMASTCCPVQNSVFPMADAKTAKTLKRAHTEPTTPTPNMNWALSKFCHEYAGLHSSEPGPVSVGSQLPSSPVTDAGITYVFMFGENGVWLWAQRYQGGEGGGGCVNVLEECRRF